MELVIPCIIEGCHQPVLLSNDPRASAVLGVDGMKGTCSNQTCGQEYFVCMCCYKDISPPFVYNRYPGVMRNWKSVTKHGKAPSHIANKTAMKKSQEKNESANNNGTALTEKDDASLVDLDDFESGGDMDDVSSMNDNSKRGQPVNSLEDIKAGGFHPDSKSPDYFWFEHQNPGKGVKYLTSKAFSVNVDNVTAEEAGFSLVVSSLLMQLSEGQRKLFAECMLQAANWRTEKSIFTVTCPPTCEEEFQKTYLTGKDAIIPNLPHPVPCKSTDGTHAYVTLKDVLANELAKGTKFDDSFSLQADIVMMDNDEVPTMSTTPAALSLRADLNKKNEEDEDGEYVMNLWFKQWRDDFDPNGTKSNRNSVWANTFTICPPPDESGGRNTYLMAISCKGDDHSEAEKLFTSQMLELENKPHVFYHGGMKRMIKVRLANLSTCVDRPERTSMFQLGDCNGTYSAYWGHACMVDGTLKENHLPNCKKCREKLVREQLLSEKRNGNTGTNIEACQDCSSWDVMNSGFSFPAPKKYPTVCDVRAGAPQPPKGREVPLQYDTMTGPGRVSGTHQTVPISGSRNNKRSRVIISADVPSPRLRTVKYTFEWLMEAVSFAHHNIKTKPPNGTVGRRQKYWNKQEMEAYLTTCGLNNKFINRVYCSAKDGNDDPPLAPATWNIPRALSFCHFAVMHQIFLGTTKSDYVMLSNWLTKKEILSAFGRQANLFLYAITKLRSTKYFCAHRLSTSSWGQGPWVSENCLCWARLRKFFMTLPALYTDKIIKNPENTWQLKMFSRFAAASLASVSRIMSRNNSDIPDFDRVIKIYLDTMVEVDQYLFRLRDSEREPDTSTTSQANQNNRNGGNGNGGPKTSRKKKANFVKSNSLGLMSVAAYHSNLGNAFLHWEGGPSGENGITVVKPYLGIKRANADWQPISLKKSHQHACVEQLKAENQSNTLTRPRKRAMDGILKIYKTKQLLVESVSQCLPMVGIRSEENKIWLPYRPSTSEERQDVTRSSVDVVEITFSDHLHGELVKDLCWMAPILLSNNEKSFSSVLHINESFAKEFVLLLPKLDDDGSSFLNFYYAVGSNWTERMKDGNFVVPKLNESVFEDWMTDLATDDDSSDLATDDDSSDVATDDDSSAGSIQ